MQSELITEPVAADVSHVDRDVSDHIRRAPDAYQLIERAVEKGLDPAQLKALVDLHEQMRAARAKEAFNDAMKCCQEELPVIIKDAENTHTKSRYSTLDHVQKIAKPVYTKHGFALSFGESDCPIPGQKRTICKLRHCLGHTEIEQLDLPLDGTGSQGGRSAMNAVQGAISTGSYAQRVLTCRIFNITISDTDLDGRPPANDNPEMRPDAPKVEPRGRRQPPPPKKELPKFVTVEQVQFLKDRWKETISDPTPDGWSDFAQTKAGRIFDVGKAANWTIFDVRAIQQALGIPTDEDLEGGK